MTTETDPEETPQPTNEGEPNSGDTGHASPEAESTDAQADSSARSADEDLLRSRIAQFESLMAEAEDARLALKARLAQLESEAEEHAAEWSEIIEKHTNLTAATAEQLLAATGASDDFVKIANDTKLRLAECDHLVAEADRVKTALEEKLKAVQLEAEEGQAAWNQLLAAQKTSWEQERSAVTATLADIQALSESARIKEQAVAAHSAGAEGSAALALQSANSAQTSSTQASAAATDAQSNANSIEQLSASVAAHVQNVADADASSALGLAQVSKAQIEALEIIKRAKVAAAEAKEQMDSARESSAAIVRATTDIKDHDKILSDFEPKYNELFAKINSLLPGAASAGLASEFKAQKESYMIPKLVLAGVLLVSTILIAAVLIWGSGDSELQKHTTNIWEALLVDVLHRSPLLAPLIILAAFAYRYYAIADRMEQDYAYKQRLSASFEGYKGQFANLPTQPGQPSPLAGLCSTIIQVIGQHPARFYDKNHREQLPSLASPIDALVEGIGRIASQEEPPASDAKEGKGTP